MQFSIDLTNETPVVTPLLEECEMTLTLLKWGRGRLQSRIAGVKTPCIGVIFISLENYESLDVENELTWAIWTFVAQVMCKRKAGSQIGNLIPDH
jgi:hypothetical protein